ncbi:MAG TPA: VWA domain-containing protein [Bryobacteraceae bacterium]|nr:VWA domain-containing protein [Bryobacteraceae bacterium]
MNRRSAIRALLMTGAGSILSRAFADTPRGEAPGFVIRSDVRLVLLDVSVKDRAGGFVSGLSRDDFRVDENGTPQNITVFADSDVPVTVGLLVDNSRSMLPKRDEVLVAATTFIQESNPRDEIFVLNFNDTVKRGLPSDMLFSDDVQQLRAAISHGIPEGRTALNDAVIDGLEQLEKGRRDKKTLVLISDGGDNASHHTRKQMLAAVERSIATIYTIGLFDALDPDRDLGILKKLARISGGEPFFPTDGKALIEVCRGIAKDIRTRYTVGYIPEASNGGPVRHIHVHVSAPGRATLTARTRSTYIYDEASNEKGG